MRISVYERGSDSGKFKFNVFVDPVGSSMQVGSTILQANRGFDVNQDFAKVFFGLTQTGVCSSGDKWKEASKFLNSAFLHGLKNYLASRESFSYVGYPQLDFLRDVLRVEPGFNLHIIDGKDQPCHVYEMVFFCRRASKKFYDKRVNQTREAGDYYAAHLALRFFIGAIFDISDTTSRFEHERDQLVNPTYTIEINFHLNFVKGAGVAVENDLYKKLRGDMPNLVELTRQYNLLSRSTKNELPRVVYSRADSSYCGDADQYTFTKKESAKGKFKKRDIYRADSPERIVQYFEVKQTEETRGVLCEGAGRVSPTMILMPAAEPCRFFNTFKGCRYGDQCQFSHDVEALRSSVEWRF